MWYKISRDEYSKYQLFENFGTIVRDIYELIENHKENESFYKILTSENLNLNITINSTKNNKFLAYYDPNLNSIFVNLENIVKKFGRKAIYQTIRNILIHEIQHLVEHYYKGFNNILQNENKKHNKWTQNAYDNSSENNPEDFENDYKYFNDPIEVRARLSEILAAYRLPEEKKHMQEKINKKGNNYQTYINLIKDVFSDKHIYMMDFLSPKAKEYMVKEFYKAVWN